MFCRRWMVDDTLGSGLLGLVEPGASLSLGCYIWSDSRRLKETWRSLIESDSLLPDYVRSSRQLGLTYTDEHAQANWHPARPRRRRGERMCRVATWRMMQSDAPQEISKRKKRGVFTVTPLKFLWAQRMKWTQNLESIIQIKHILV